MLQQHRNRLPLHEVKAVLRILREAVITVIVRDILPLIVGFQRRMPLDQMLLIQLQLAVPFIQRHDAGRDSFADAVLCKPDE